DSERAEKLGFSPIKPDLDAIDALASKEALAPLLAGLHERGMGGLFDCSVGPDDRHSTVYALQFSQGGISLPDRDYYFDKQFAKERAAYQAHIEKMLTLLGTPKEKIPG